MKNIKSLIIKIKLLYYTFIEWLEKELNLNGPRDVDIQVIERRHENAKLARGVRRLVQRLRGMSKEERLSTENLLSSEPYKKSRKEKMDELRVQDRVNKNPTLKTEDDLVNTVVKKAPMYAKEQELKVVRKAITACLRAASDDPTNDQHTKDMKRLTAKSRLLKGEIQRLKHV